MGLLSYSFVTVTLLADLGLPWHFWQLGVQAPEHSAMFEVSWCVGLYVTILAFEFMPVPFERWGMQTGDGALEEVAPVWVVFAVTLFVWLMSRKRRVRGRSPSRCSPCSPGRSGRRPARSRSRSCSPSPR